MTACDPSFIHEMKFMNLLRQLWSHELSLNGMLIILYTLSPHLLYFKFDQVPCNLAFSGCFQAMCDGRNMSGCGQVPTCFKIWEYSSDLLIGLSTSTTCISKYSVNDLHSIKTSLLILFCYVLLNALFSYQVVPALPSIFWPPPWVSDSCLSLLVSLQAHNKTPLVPQQRTHQGISPYPPSHSSHTSHPPWPPPPTNHTILLYLQVPYYQ